MFNTAVTKLNAPPVSVVLNWKASYDDSQGELIDMSQAVPGYTAHDDMLAALAEAAQTLIGTLWPGRRRHATSPILCTPP